MSRVVSLSLVVFKLIFCGHLICFAITLIGCYLPLACSREWSDLSRRHHDLLLPRSGLERLLPGPSSMYV